MEQMNKIVRLNENENSNKNEEQVKVDDGGGEENNDSEMSDMDKLPNEILMKILDYLDEQELNECRLLNSRWNEICCLLLQVESTDSFDSNLSTRNSTTEAQQKPSRLSTENLDDFIDCFRPSEAEKSSGRRRPFPFCAFKIQNLHTMGVTRMCEFVQTFGPQMKTIIVDINPEDFASFKSFWKLLLHFAPNIQHLRIISDSSLNDVILFDPVAKFIAESDPSSKVTKPKDTFLKNLKVLGIVSSNFGEFNDFMKDLLDNAPNLEQVSSMDPSHQSDWKHLQVWQQLNKAHLIKALEIKSNSTNILSPVPLMKNLQIEKFRAKCKFSSTFVENETSTANYIYHVLKSSQETLTSLTHWKLNMKFMALAFKDISSLPNVHQLQITVQHPEETENVFQKLRHLCPNATCLKFGFSLRDFSQVVPILWTQFQGLKSLILEIWIRDENNDNLDQLVLDSAISGYSSQSIEKIQTKLNDGISLEEARRNEQQKPSILDLKGLSRFDLNFKMRTKTEETEDLKNQLQSTIFIKILPQHIRENPRSICYL